MPPILLHTKWNQRPSDSEVLLEPLRKYFIICEGANTESFYFKKLISIKKEIGIDALIDVVFIEKTEEDKDISYPKKLIEFAKEKRSVLMKSGDFDINRDIMIITFDLDIFKHKVDNLEDLLKQQDDNLLFGVAYPDFELFLLLHVKDSVDQILNPCKEIILANEKKGNKRPCQIYLRQLTGINSKKNKEIGELAKHIDVAIMQEKRINQDLKYCLQNLTSNIAAVIEKIKQDKLFFS